jgi:isoleucyl-tRNA synthetase
MMRSEIEVLAWWNEHAIAAKSIERGASPYVFFEGPPTANGKPGIHHVAARSFKDLYPRYQTMRGHRVLRRAGWDTHGLPVEVEVEKKIGSKGKQDIEKYGIAEFNRLCRESVFSYIGDWNKLTERIGFWLDLEHPYITYTNDYMETCWWILRDLWDRGFLYEAYRTTMHCPRCNTSLADHEVSLGMRDEVDDPSIWPKFRLRSAELEARGLVDAAEERPVWMLAWTTTPWTLPANVALCVKPGATYALIEAPARHAHEDGPRELYVLAESLAPATFAEGTWSVVRTMEADALTGLRYEPLFHGHVPADTDLSGAWRVIADDFVSLEDGTGIVHIAPAYGDLEYGLRYGLPTLFSVDLTGSMDPEVRPMTSTEGAPDLAGLFFKDADPLITRMLTHSGEMFRSGRVTHAYPFCWRDDTPLLFFAKNSWYIRTTLVKDKLLANNAKINWVPPSAGIGRFGNWLENNVDWALSRERYWGCPLPIWQNDEGAKICVGSVAELSALAGRDLSELDLHRPHIDGITFEHEGSTYRRVPYTIDVWFESGAMPYAQWHFPFENQQELYENFPADYICEAVDQTRGWFYTLHAIATLLTDTGGDGRRPGPLADRFPDSPAFKNCVVLGLLTDREGKKMSKSRGNVVDPWSILDNQGADALRWYLYSSGPPGESKAFDARKVTEVLRAFLMTLSNTNNFFALYARVDEPDLITRVPLGQRPEIDRWLLADLSRVVASTTAALDRYDAMTASRGIQSFVIDRLSNWYVRNNRRRFWKSTDEGDKRAAYQTLYETLVTVAKLIAPMAPFLAEELYRGLVVLRVPDAPESVHLTEWPEVDPAAVDERLLADMDLVLRVVELGRAARSQAQIRVRQPLPELIVRVGNEDDRAALQRLEELILRELNVKRLTLLDVNTRFVSYVIRPNLPVAGRILGKDMPKLTTALREIDPYVVVDNVHRGVLTEVPIGDRTVALGPDAFLITVSNPPGYFAVESGGLLAALNTELTDALIAEGRVRELVRFIQEARKKAELDVTDRIRLRLEVPDDFSDALNGHRDYIADETLALEIAMLSDAERDSATVVKIDEYEVRFVIERVG